MAKRKAKSKSRTIKLSRTKASHPVKKVQPVKKIRREHNLLAALSYLLWPLALILIVIEETKRSPADRHLRHHAYNAMGFALAWFAIWVFIEILSSLLFSAFVLTKNLFALAVIIIALVFAYRAYKGQEVTVPFVTPFLEKHIKGF